MAAKKKQRNYLKIVEVGVIVLAAIAAIVKLFSVKKKKK
jgi:hypothetical protein